MRRLGDLDLDVPVELLRKRLGDEDGVVAGATAMLIGRRKISALADALLERLGRGEDVAMGACAVALAGMGDPRVLEFLRRQCRRGPLGADPSVWLALSTLKGPEANRLLQEAFEQVPARGSAPLALLIAEAFVGSDPQAAIPLVIDRWLDSPDGEEADAMLAALLAAAGYPGGVGGLRESMRPDRESSWPGLPDALLASLSQHVPLRLTADASRSARKGKWVRLVEELLSIADWLEAEAGDPALSGRALTLVRALGARSRRLGGAPEKAGDASGLMLLSLSRLSQTVRARTLGLPEAPEDRLRWLLSDAAVPWPDEAASVQEQLAGEAPPEAWVAACVRAVERRTEQAAAAAELLGAWRAEAGVAALAGALGDREDPDVAEAVGDALAEIGEAAVDAVLARLGSAEDPVLIEDCLTVCESLPSRRVVAAIGRRFEDLFIHAPEPLLRTARILGARELLAPLGRELREGEAAAEQAFAFLCQLHRVTDPRLEGISRRLNERLRRAEAPEGDAGPEAEPSLDVALRCNGCRRTYSYAVREICVDPEAKASEGFQPFIRDRIRCKGCGREDDYSLPEKTQFLLLGELARLTERSQTEGLEVFDDSPFRFLRLGLSDGRRLQPREARRDYEERLARRPDDPDLLVGYANVLRLLGEAELAEGSLRRVLELDPAAADAYATLGQFAEERGDLAEAEAMYRQVVALGRKGRFYRVKDRRDFLERVEEALVRIQGARAVRPPEPVSAQARLEALGAQDRRATKVGRNDPCPCGSGKKYKKCCLPKAEAASEGRRPEAADERLRQRLAAYVGASLPEAEMQRALREFFGEQFDGRRRGPALDAPGVEGESAAFLEWLIHDFRLPAGQTPIARFLAERGRNLPAEERAILEEWQDAAVGLHEVVDLEPGRSLTLRDVFTGERLTVREVRGSLFAARWDLIGGRVIRVHGEPFLSGVVTAFHASDREDLVAHVQERYQAHCRDHPGASWREFFRAEPLVLHRYAERLAREARPPRVVTSEGHPVMLGRLRYDVRDSRRLLKALAAASDFEETTDPGGPADTRSFAWVRSGPAQRYVKTAQPPEGSITLAGQRLEPDGTEMAPGLAGLTLEGQRLTVEALSAERLAWAKARLAELAGDALALRADVVEDPMRKIGAMHGPESPEAGAPDIPPEIQIRLIGQMLHKHYTAWLDLQIPALDNRTPRQAARDVVLRPRLVQLLREIENRQDRERQQGKPWYDAAWMWEALGVPRTEA